MTTYEATVIHLRGVPPSLYARAVARHDELLREFMHIAHAQPEDRGSVPARLLPLMEDVRMRHGASSTRLRERLVAALDAGEEHIDLALPAAPGRAEDARAFLEALEEADEYCRSGELLTLEAPAELVELRRWCLGELIRQPRGERPRPWPEHRDARLAGR
jgi:hypothetical protein